MESGGSALQRTLQGRLEAWRVAYEGGIDDIDDSFETVGERTLELDELREWRFDLRPSLSTWSTLTPWIILNDSESESSSVSESIAFMPAEMVGRGK